MTGQTPGAMPRRTRGLALTAALALLGGVAACSPENIAERVIEAGSDGNVDIDDGGGQVTIDSEDGGTATFGSDGTLPDGFPDSVPVVSGDIVYAQSMSAGDTTDFAVNIQTSGTVSDVFAQIKSDLEGAGFEKASESTVTSDGANFSSAQYTSADYEVFVNVTSTEQDAVGVSYVVNAVMG